MIGILVSAAGSLLGGLAGNALLGKGKGESVTGAGKNISFATFKTGKGDPGIQIPQVDASEALAMFAQAPKIQEKYYKQGLDYFMKTMEQARKYIVETTRQANQELRPLSDGSNKAFAELQRFVGIDPLSTTNRYIEDSQALNSPEWLQDQIMKMERIKDTGERKNAREQLKSMMQDYEIDRYKLMDEYVTNSNAEIKTYQDRIEQLRQQGLTYSANLIAEYAPLHYGTLTADFDKYHPFGTSEKFDQYLNGWVGVEGSPSTLSYSRGEGQGMATSADFGGDLTGIAEAFASGSRKDLQDAIKKGIQILSNGNGHNGYNATLDMLQLQALEAKGMAAKLKAEQNAKVKELYDDLKKQQILYKNYNYDYTDEYDKGYTGAEVADKIKATPGYDFMFQEGTKAIERKGSAAGMLGSAQTAIGLQKYGQDLALNFYQTHLSNLGNIAAIGSGATSQISSNIVGLGANLANLESEKGQTTLNTFGAIGDAYATSLYKQGETSVQVAEFNAALMNEAMMHKRGLNQSQSNASMGMAASMMSGINQQSQFASNLANSRQAARAFFQPQSFAANTPSFASPQLAQFGIKV